MEVTRNSGKLGLRLEKETCATRYVIFDGFLMNADNRSWDYTVLRVCI